jgi:septum formation protein
MTGLAPDFDRSDNIHSQQGLKTAKDDPRRPYDLAAPGRRLRVDKQHVSREPYRGDASHGGAYGCLPGELDFASRDGLEPQQISKRSRHRLSERFKGSRPHALMFDPIIYTRMPLILASASPRRAELLTAAGYAFQILVADVDERSLDGERPPDYVQRLARDKSVYALDRWLATAALNGVRRSDALRIGAAENASNLLVVVGADTAVVVADEILGKPRDPEDAARMLRRLSGRTHQVMTGVSVRTETSSVSTVEVTGVAFNPLSEDDIAWYVASGEGRDKAGGYAIQGLASRFIPRIEGSYSNVVGLPIAALDALLRRVGRASGLLASHG